MYTAQRERRSFLAVTISIVIAFVLILFNLAIQFLEGMYGFLHAYTKFPISQAVIHFLFVWLAVLLFLALRRWRAVETERSDLEAILSSISPDALVVVGPDRSIRMCNESVERIFGRKPQEVVGQKTDILYHDRRSNPDRPREIYEMLANRGFHYGLAKGKRRDGGTVPLEIITGELVGKNGAVMLIRDITERLVLEEQRRRLEERALQAQKLESLGVLAGGVAHDFNNLLMIMQGHADLMLMRNPSEAYVTDGLSEIMKAAQRARELCRHLLSFAGRAPRDVRPTNLTLVVRDAMGMLRVRIPTNVRVELELSEALRSIPADESQVHQVVMNLVTNACDAMGVAGGRLCVATGEMHCDSDYLTEVAGAAQPQAGHYVFLRVADSGCGMDETTRRRVCEPFFTTKNTGNGMGMAAVLGIMRSHHGLLRLDSRVGEGTTITALFPVPETP